MSIAIEPNYEIFMQFVFIYFICMSFMYLFQGLFKVKKETNEGKNYGIGEVILSLLMFIVIGIVIL